MGCWKWDHGDIPSETVREEKEERSVCGRDRTSGSRHADRRIPRRGRSSRHTEGVRRRLSEGSIVEQSRQIPHRSFRVVHHGTEVHVLLVRFVVVVVPSDDRVSSVVAVVERRSPVEIDNRPVRLGLDACISRTILRSQITYLLGGGTLPLFRSMNGMCSQTGAI